ncbi:MAG: YbaB/EbfC family nucleoid-associated protein [Firmicutes bacterium]|nr:YbaB/EbfC family nucleoid-associated protein [Bacillota bacterium]
MNMGNMMKQMQKMQKDMAKMQEDLQQRTLEVTSGGGVVRVEVNGKKEIISLEIDPQAVDPEDVEMLQDMIIAAVNEGLRKIDEMTMAEMKKLTGGLNLPPGLL